MLNASFDLLNDSVFDQDSDDDKIPTGPSTLTIVNCILNVPLLVLSILGNTMVLTAVLKTPSLRSPSIILLCGLAASATYSSLVTKSRVKLTLILIWLINSGLNIWYTPTNFHLAMVLVGVYISASTVSYIGIYRIVRRHNAEIYAQRQALEYPSAQNVYGLAMLTRTTTNTFVFYISTIFCYLPWFIYRIFYREKFPVGSQEAWIFTVTLVFANSAINPFLYCWRIRDLRKAVIKISRWKISCKWKEESKCRRGPFAMTHTKKTLRVHH